MLCCWVQTWNITRFYSQPLETELGKLLSWQKRNSFFPSEKIYELHNSPYNLIWLTMQSIELKLSWDFFLLIVWPLAVFFCNESMKLQINFSSKCYKNSQKPFQKRINHFISNPHSLSFSRFSLFLGEFLWRTELTDCSWQWKIRRYQSRMKYSKTSKW